jgi:tetratricopeptide (TPR) repeat protein
MDKVSTAQFYLEQSVKYSQQNDWQGMISQLQKGIAIQPNEPLLHCQMGEALLALGKVMEAINHLETALKLPASPEVQAYGYWLLGRAYEQNQWSALAFEAYSQALILNPYSFTPEAHVFMGKVYHQRQDYASARTCYQRALAIDPHHQLAHSQIVRTYLAESALDSAYQKLTEIANLDPELPLATDVVDLAIAYAQRQNFALAQELLHQAIALDTQCATAHYHLGNLFCQQNQLREAVFAYKEALDLDPHLAPAYYSLGNVLLALQQTAEAIACFEAVLALDPAFTPARTKLEELKPSTPATSPDTPLG